LPVEFVKKVEFLQKIHLKNSVLMVY